MWIRVFWPFFCIICNFSPVSCKSLVSEIYNLIISWRFRFSFSEIYNLTISWRFRFSFSEIYNLIISWRFRFAFSEIYNLTGPDVAISSATSEKSWDWPFSRLFVPASKICDIGTWFWPVFDSTWPGRGLFWPHFGLFWPYFGLFWPKFPCKVVFFAYFSV